jgi:glycosyltransferase involved in cell wall biosynthesis
MTGAPEPRPASPRIAVVIPAFNAAAFLAETLRSVQAQTVPEWELIVVDDGSSDATAAIVRAAAAADARIRLVQQANAGVSVARNRGVAESRAPLIAFLDADDLWHPAKIAAHLRLHQEDGGIGVSFARVEFLTPAGAPSGVRSAARRQPPDPAELLAENPTTTTSNWVVRRPVFAEVGGFLEGMNHSEDLEWLLRVACCSPWRFGVLPEVLTFYRTSGGGLSSGLERMEEGWLRLAEEARRYAPELVRREYARAHAIQLRYLARRSLRLGGPATVGLDYLGRSLRSDWTLLLSPPRRTGLTALAVLARSLIAPRAMPRPRQELPPLAAEPLVSVVIPLYNSAATVAATLESVLQQTYRNLEIIVVDDGSTDEGVEICRRCRDPRLRIVQQRNRGLAGARNTGIRHARGAIVAFVDSDDLWMPEKIARHVEHLSRHPEVGVSFSRSALIDRDGQPLGLLQTPRLRGITAPLILCRNPISNGSCVVLRREVLDGIRFRDTLYGEPEDYWFDDSFRQSEDIECWLRIAVQTDFAIEGIPQALTLYRVNSGGLSADIEKQYASWCRVLDKAAGYAPGLIARHGRRARAYQLRYLARRAIRERQPRLGLRLMARALRTSPRILLEEPARTLITLLAAGLGCLLPSGCYEWLERRMMNLVGSWQRLRIPAPSSAAREG